MCFVNITGRFIEGLEIPVCDKFREEMTDHQLCYSMDVGTLASERKLTMQPGKGNGLLFAIDKGLSIGPQHEEATKNDELKNLLSSKNPVDKNSVRLHISTLDRYIELVSSGIRVAKCQFFYTDNFCPTKFTQRKGA